MKKPKKLTDVQLSIVMSADAHWQACHETGHQGAGDACCTAEILDMDSLTGGLQVGRIGESLLRYLEEVGLA